MTLSEQQLNFFQTFGFLVFPGLMREEIAWITTEFEKVFQASQIPRHDGTKRTCIVPFIDQSEKLCTLLDHPAIDAIASSLLGADFNYLGGDGNYYVGDTAWHSDGWHETGLFIKMALYLDPVGRDSGCLRVIPGSHLPGPWVERVRQAGRSQENFGVPGSALPSHALESTPGDLVVFNHNLHHASFGGSAARRMFTLNLSKARHGTEGDPGSAELYHQSWTLLDRPAALKDDARHGEPPSLDAPSAGNGKRGRASGSASATSGRIRRAIPRLSGQGRLFKKRSGAH